MLEFLLLTVPSGFFLHFALEFLGEFFPSYHTFRPLFQLQCPLLLPHNVPGLSISLAISVVIASFFAQLAGSIHRSKKKLVSPCGRSDMRAPPVAQLLQPRNPAAHPPSHKHRLRTSLHMSACLPGIGASHSSSWQRSLIWV